MLILHLVNRSYRASLSKTTLALKVKFLNRVWMYFLMGGGGVLSSSIVRASVSVFVVQLVKSVKWEVWVGVLVLLEHGALGSDVFDTADTPVWGRDFDVLKEVLCCENLGV